MSRSDELAQTKQQLDEAAGHIDELRDAVKQQEEHLMAAEARADDGPAPADARLQEALDAATEQLQQIVASLALPLEVYVRVQVLEHYSLLVHTDNMSIDTRTRSNVAQQHNDDWQRLTEQELVAHIQSLWRSLSYLVAVLIEEKDLASVRSAELERSAQQLAEAVHRVAELEAAAKTQEELTLAAEGRREPDEDDRGFYELLVVFRDCFRIEHWSTPLMQLKPGEAESAIKLELGTVKEELQQSHESLRKANSFPHEAYLDLTPNLRRVIQNTKHDVTPMNKEKMNSFEGT
eukprot:308330-Amphidinium_carterae.1